MIPCKLNKCLLYPACKHKTTIKCPDLREYYHKLDSNIIGKIIVAILEFDSAQAYERKIWKKINETLPNLKTISSYQTKGICDPVIRSPLSLIEDLIKNME
jgi:hypothetical protein